MKRRSFITSASISAGTLGGASLASAALGYSQSTCARDASRHGEVVILHTNDTHSRIMPFENGPHKGRGGVARRAALFERVRNVHDRVLALDAGDVFQGTPWFNTYKGAVDLELMGRMGYDAFVLGNHDFDAGSEQLVSNLRHEQAPPAIVANYTCDESSPLVNSIEASKIFDVKGLRVGVFGLGIAFQGLVTPRLHKGVRYLDPRETAREQVSLLRQANVDLVVCMSHLGIKGHMGEVSDIELTRDVRGIDYVLGGHTHTFMEQPERVLGPGGWASAVMHAGHSGLVVGMSTLRPSTREGVALKRSSKSFVSV